MKKHISDIILVIVIIVLLLVVTFLNNQYHEKKATNKPENNTVDNEIIDLNNLTDYYLVEEHLKYAAMFFTGKNYDTFTNEDLTIFMAFNLLTNGQKATLEEIQKCIFEHFGIKGFVPQPGEYYANGSGPIQIIKENNMYSSDILGRGGPNIFNRFISKEIKDNQVIVHYIYGEALGFDSENPDYKDYGLTDIYLELIDNNLIIKKIVYTEITE